MVAEILDIAGEKREDSLTSFGSSISQSAPLRSGIYDLKVSVAAYLTIIKKGQSITTLDSTDYDYPANRVGQIRVRDGEKVAVKSQDGSSGTVFLFKVTQ